jgi:hypothetical protein
MHLETPLPIAFLDANRFLGDLVAVLTEVAVVVSTFALPHFLMNRDLRQMTSAPFFSQYSIFRG